MSTTHQPAGTAIEPRINPLSTACDGDLLEAWTRDGCREALTAIIDRYSVLVLSVCRRSCRNRADADDAFQSTFLYLVRSASKIRNPDQLAGWLHRVAQRAAIATLGLGSPKTERVIDFPDDPCNPFDRLTQRHTAIVLDEELANLPEHYRTAIVLHLVQGESYLTLAEKWGATVGTVRGRVQRGKQLLARRLRRRGVIPVIAFSAATQSTVTQADAAQAAQSLANDVAFPHDSVSPLEPSLLQSLLTQGSSAMAKSFIASSGLLGIALLVFVLYDVSHFGQTSRAESLLVTQQNPGSANQSEADFVQPASGGAPASQAGSSQTSQSMDMQPTRRDSEAALVGMDALVELPSSVSLDALPSLMHRLAKIPVMMDERALAFADVSADASLDFPEGQVPLRSALHRALRPLGLRAVVDDEGITITADPAVLVHRGIGVSRWLNVDEEAERMIASNLAAKVTYSFVEETLENALRIIAEDRDLPILLDRKALEATPYTPDTPVNLSLSNVTLRTFFELLLRDLELTYTIQGEILVITTPEIAELVPLTRIYWLEGTGLTGGNGPTVMDTIESTIDPNAWAEAGGTSTLHIITRGRDSRPAILVSAPYTTHHQLENLFSVTRESHFGPDPPFEPAENKPSVPVSGGMGGTGGGMDGGFH